MTDENIKEVFQYRTHMLPFHANYRENKEVEVCLLCKSHPDCQDSLEDCKELEKEHPNMKSIKSLYEDGENIKAAKLLNSVLKTRALKLSELTKNPDDDGKH